MPNEKLARLSSGEVRFTPINSNGEYGDEITLGYNQKVSLNRSSEVKELLSNDTSLGATASEIETKTTYEFSTEIGDLSLSNLALAFKGLIQDKTYQAGDKFINGKVILDGNANVTGKIGDAVIKDNKIYILTAAASNKTFDSLSLAVKTYPTKVKILNPESRSNNMGRIVVDGINLATGKAQILVIPKVNLRYDGEFGIVGDDFIKLSLSGKAIKVDGEDIFTLIDGVD
ncbi:hypothetical protein CCAL12920_00720 [Campylobacter sp. RM12920]|uniref:Uncharacterized protein n=1 Tax=Campylobacter californiensis TaxID=1032243 RepID=A0ABD4JFI7_9BACT|nr:hypothetical protein [Campylobacter sp. RM12919]MBE2987423.1 hypothetical protein [Campylobacter sp. RM12920]